MILTEQQLKFFDTFGFLHYPGLYDHLIDSVVATAIRGSFPEFIFFRHSLMPSLTATIGASPC